MKRLTDEQMDGLMGRLTSGETCIRWHHLKAFGRSPAQGIDELLGLAPEKKSKAIESGSAVDEVVLGEVLAGFDGTVVPCEGPDPDDPTKITPIVMNAKHKRFQDFLAAHPGKIPQTQKDFAETMAMADSLKECPVATRYLSGVRREAARLKFKIDGLWCQITPDSLHPDGDFLADLKRPGDGILPDGFVRHAKRMGWFGQLAFYGHGIFQAKAFSPKETVIVCVEAKPHLAGGRHEVVSIPIPQKYLDEGWARVEELWETMEDCFRTGEFPGYGRDGILDISNVDEGSW